MPSANLGGNIAIFEAVHGSAPLIAGKNIANPTACILSAAMMLNYLGKTAAAKSIVRAVEDVICGGKYITPDQGGNSTSQEITKVIYNLLNILY